MNAPIRDEEQQQQTCQPQSAFLYSCRVDGQSPQVSHITSCEPYDGAITQSIRTEIHDHVRNRANAGRAPNLAGAAAAAVGAIQCDYIQPIALRAAAEQDDDAWMSKRMASDCGPDYNPNQALIINHFECRYVGKGTLPDGRVVSNPHKVWKGRLASCHAQDGLAVSDQLMRDVQKYAYHAAHGDEAKLDVSQFVCDIVSVPTM